MESSSLANLRLWQLISPALPVGAYAYSQGLESALHAGWLKNASDVSQWIQGLMENTLCRLDIPVLRRLYHAWSADDAQRIEQWSLFILAAREARELQEEDLHLGRALATLLTDLEIAQAEAFKFSSAAPFINLLALAGVHWQVKLEDLAMGYLWSWCENQVAAGIKLVPLGQTSGQKMLSALAQTIPATVAIGLSLEDDEIGAAAPGLGIASAMHETQYSRLFRS